MRIAKLFSLSYLALLSSNIFPQAGRGRGYDPYDSYGGGDGGWFFYFLVVFWGIIFLIAIVKIILEFIADNYERWLQSILEFSKSILEFSKTFFIFFLSMSIGLALLIGFIILFGYLINQIYIPDYILNFRVPKYLEYFGRFLVCVFWLGFIRYTFLKDKSNTEIMNFFKKLKGLLVGILIILLMLVLIFG